jgi:uncharacterized protein YjiS (DUF1127 family)
MRRALSNFVLKNKSMQQIEEDKPKRFRIDTKRLRNKYVIASFLFIIWVVFFDQNNLVERAQNRKELRRLKEDQIY